MKNFLLLILALLVGFNWVQAQSPMKFNYQGVARNSDYTAISSQDISIRIALRKGSDNGPIEYEEDHFSLTTSPTGVFSIVIGDGLINQGDLSLLEWGADSYYLKVSMDKSGGSSFVNMGTSQLLSVPYAIHALNASNTGSDGDSDASNEIQSLTINDNGMGQFSLGISDANTVSFDVNDADSDVSNEIQSLAFDNNTGELSITGSNTVQIPLSSGGDNWGAQSVQSNNTIDGNGTSASPLSVIGDLTDDQLLSISGHELTIANGNSITLPDETEDDDADPDNELQTIGKSGDLVELSHGGGTFIDEYEDDDADPENELQELSISGDELSISDGNTVILPSAANSPWSENIDNSPYINTHRVGIGTDDPFFDLHIENDNDLFCGMYTDNNGVFTVFGSSSGSNIGVVGTTSADPMSFGANNQIALTADVDLDIGIGIQAPNHALQVHRDALSQIALTTDDAYTVIESFDLGTSFGNWDSRPLFFYTRKLPRMYIAEDGLIGINTETPQVELNIVEKSNSNTSPQLRLDNGNKYWTIGTNSNSGALRFTSSTGNLWFIREDGTTSLMADPNDNSSTSIPTQGTIDIIGGLESVTRFKNGNTSFEIDINSLERTLPDLVSIEKVEMPDGTVKEYKGVSYNQLIPILVKALNEQQVEFKTQSISYKELSVEVDNQKILILQLQQQMNDLLDENR